LDSGCSTAFAFKASISDPDTMTYEQAMMDTEHVDEWLKCMEEEIKCFEEIGSWTEVDVSEAKSKIIPGTWVFRVKRTPDGAFKKRKARFCCRGDLQEVDFETFAPVVSWTSVRFFLVLSVILGWVTCSIDFNSEDDPDEKRFLEINSCSTHVMRADILTKGLLNEKFEANRKLNQGW
jgi:hypothetical protein